MKKLFTRIVFLICKILEKFVLVLSAATTQENSTANPIRFAQLNEVRLAYEDSIDGDIVVIFD